MTRNLKRTTILVAAVGLAGLAVAGAAPVTDHEGERMHDGMMLEHDEHMDERKDMAHDAHMDERKDMAHDEHMDEREDMAREEHMDERKHVAMTPEDVEWVKDPDALPPGARVAVLMGDPATEDPLAMRVILPPEYVIPPHMHPALEQGIVLSGTLHFGTGEEIDKDAAERLPTGSYFAIPPEHPHYVFTGDEPVVFQVQSMGPWEIEYVDPADDPRHE